MTPSVLDKAWSARVAIRAWEDSGHVMMTAWSPLVCPRTLAAAITSCVHASLFDGLLPGSAAKGQVATIQSTQGEAGSVRSSSMNSSRDCERGVVRGAVVLDTSVISAVNPVRNNAGILVLRRRQSLALRLCGIVGTG